MASRDLPAMVGVSVTVPGEADCPHPVLADAATVDEFVVAAVVAAVVAVIAAVVGDVLPPELPHAAISTGMATKQAIHHLPLLWGPLCPAWSKDLIFPVPPCVNDYSIIPPWPRQDPKQT